jgi:hypothetical protein
LALIAASLLLIPVRCDASPFPHSIFVAPPGPNLAEHHAHSQYIGNEQTVPSKEEAPWNKHMPGMAASADSENGARTADPGSIQSGASMMEAPYSISLASRLALFFAEGQRLHRSLPMTDEPHGASFPPPSPPPKIAG